MPKVQQIVFSIKGQKDDLTNNHQIDQTPLGTALYRWQQTNTGSLQVIFTTVK